MMTKLAFRLALPALLVFLAGVGETAATLRSERLGRDASRRSGALMVIGNSALAWNQACTGCSQRSKVPYRSTRCRACWQSFAGTSGTEAKMANCATNRSEELQAHVDHTGLFK